MEEKLYHKNERERKKKSNKAELIITERKEEKL